MSRSRSISTEISGDKRLALLAARHGPLPVLLYTLAIPHADDWGRLRGDTTEFALQVCPALFGQLDDIEKMLDLITDAGLWRRYEVNGGIFIAFPRESWFKYQNYINAEKREHDGSKYPAPDGEEWLAWDDRPSNHKKGQKSPTITADSQSLPEIPKNPQESPRIPASPSPTPSPTEKPSNAREQKPAETPRADATPARSVKTKTNGTHNGHHPETRKDRETFIEENLQRNPHWRPVLSKRLEDADPDDWSKYGAAIIRDWIDTPDDAPAPKPASLSVAKPPPKNTASPYTEFKIN